MLKKKKRKKNKNAPMLPKVNSERKEKLRTQNRKLWDSKGTQKTTSFYGEMKNSLNKLKYPELLEKSEKLILYSRSKKIINTKKNMAIPDDVLFQILEVLLMKDNSRASEYIRNFEKTELVNFTANLAFYISTENQQFDIKKYYKTLYKGRQKGRPYRSYPNH